LTKEVSTSFGSHQTFVGRSILSTNICGIRVGHYREKIGELGVGPVALVKITSCLTCVGSLLIHQTSGQSYSRSLCYM